MCCLSFLFSPFSFPSFISIPGELLTLEAVSDGCEFVFHWNGAFPRSVTGSNHTAAITSRRHCIIYHPSWHQSPVVTAPQPRWHPCCQPSAAARSPHINISGSPGDPNMHFPHFHSVVGASKLPQPWPPPPENCGRIREAQSPSVWLGLAPHSISQIKLQKSKLLFMYVFHLGKLIILSENFKRVTGEMPAVQVHQLEW